MVIKAITSQHAEEAAFNWLLRAAAVRAPHYDLKDLAELDNRIEAHIDGLRIAGDHGWNTCAEALKLAEPGEVFASGVLALESKQSDCLARVLSVADAAPITVSGLISALGWVSAVELRGTVKDLLASRGGLERRLGIAACAVHRVDPGTVLTVAANDEDEALQSRALRAVGELKRVDLGPALLVKFQAADDACRFWAAWSSVLLGNRGEALDVLNLCGTVHSRFRTRAMDIALRALAPSDAKRWLKGLNDTGESFRHVLQGAGISGDPVYVPWLIEHMATPEVARVAAESFTMITGVDIAYEDLEGEWPEGFEAGPTENPEDEDVDLDPDEDLPWPDSRLIQSWWEINKGRFASGQRYLVGQPVTADHCQHVLRNGYQRQRNAAALELALMDPEAPLFETRAPGFRQQRQLG